MSSAPGDVLRRDDAVAVTGLVLLVALLFFDVLFGGVSLAGGDLTHYHFPLEKVVRDLVSNGEFPWWNPLIEGGQPVAANPAYEVFYPPQWLVFLPSFVYGFKLHIILHYALAALGMFALCRRLGLSPAVAGVAAIAFGCGGPLMSMNCYLPFLFCMTWLPWLGFFSIRYEQEGRPADFALAASAFALQALVGEPILLIETGLLVLMAGVALRRVGAAVAILAGGAGLAAVQLVPAMGHARDSVRSIPLDFTAVSAWSSSLARPLELLFPTTLAAPHRFVGSERPFITSIYLGMAIAVACVAGLLCRLPWWRWTVAICAAAYVLAVGAHTPLLRLLYDARIVSSVRYPEKILFGALFVATLFAATVLQRIVDGDAPVLRVARVVTAAAAVVSALAAAFTSAAFVRWTWQVSGGANAGAVAFDRHEWATTAFRGLLLLMVLLIRAPRRRSIALALFAAIDVVSVTAGLPLRVPDRFFSEPPPLLAELPPDGGRLFHQVAFDRAMEGRPLRGSPVVTRWLSRNEMVPYVPAAWGRATVLSWDFDETTLFPSRRLRVVADIARQRGDTSWPRAFMSMSNAPFRTVPFDAAVAAERAGGDIARLTPVTIAREPIAAPRYSFAREVATCSDVFDCANRLRSWQEGVALVPSSIGAMIPAGGRVQRVSESASAIDLDVAAAGRAFLVLSVTYDRHWRATIDGAAARLLPANLAYQALIIPPGMHHVRLVYRNPLVLAGGALTAAAAVAIAAFVIASRKRPTATPGAAARSESPA